MAFNDFWFSVRTAARLVFPQVDVDGPRTDLTQIEQALRRAVIWLTPRSVRGFHEEDFDFLPVSERRSLAEAVSRFREVAAQVPPDLPASAEQIEAGAKEFQQILKILAPDRYADPDAFVCGKRIEAYLTGRLPPSVAELRFRSGDDSHGQPGLWIWVVFKGGFANDKDFLEQVHKVRPIFHAAVDELGIDRWPFTRFRTEAELAEVMETAEDVTSQ